MAWLCYLRIADDDNQCISLSASVWAVIMGRHLGLDAYGLRNLAMGGSLLNIGNAQFPASMFSTETPPTEEEEEILRMHVDYGIKIAGTTPGIHEDVLAMIACHHEHQDGSGYPNELKGDAIPPFGRIANIISYYDEMITRKSPTPPKSSYEAVCELNSLAGKQLHRDAVNNFVQAIGMFPTGSLVELNTGEVAIVTEQNPVPQATPEIDAGTRCEQNPVVFKQDSGFVEISRHRELAQGALDYERSCCRGFRYRRQKLSVRITEI